MWVLDPDGSPTPIYDPNDPLVEAENKSERLYKATQRVLRDEEARRRWQEDLKIDRLPYWLHPEADYLPDDSGMNLGDLKERNV